jgi:hypothetical protein
MKIYINYFLVFICFIAVFIFCSNISGAILIGLEKYIPLSIQAMISNSIAFVAAFIVAKYVWKKRTIKKVGLIGSIFIGGLVVGSIGFVVGFIGPIVFNPTANQGPLLGIFITGPLCFIIGAIIGGIYWKTKLKGDTA